MKNILIILALFLGSCGCTKPEKNQYRLEVNYTNGDMEVITCEGKGERTFLLGEGDLCYRGGVLVSGVRSFKVLSVIKIFDETLRDQGCDCKISIIKTEKIKI
jgi:hypothetical protein